MYNFLRTLNVVTKYVFSFIILNSNLLELLELFDSPNKFVFISYGFYTIKIYNSSKKEKKKNILPEILFYQNTYFQFFVLMNF